MVLSSTGKVRVGILGCSDVAVRKFVPALLVHFTIPVILQTLVAIWMVVYWKLDRQSSRFGLPDSGDAGKE